MTDTAPTHCGHEPRYIVQAGEARAVLDEHRRKLRQAQMDAGQLGLL